MKKRRKIFQRAAALLCCIFLIPFLIAVRVDASIADDIFFDVLEFSTANDSGYHNVSGSLPFSVVYRTSQEPYQYVDMLVISDIPDLSVSYAGYELQTSLISSSSGYMYRVYGDLVGDPSGYLTFIIDGSSGSTVIFEQLRVTSLDFSQSVIQSTGRLWCNHPEYGTYYEDMTTPQSDVRITFDIYKYYDTTTFHSQVTPFEWKNFDYVDLFLTVSCSSIDSITVNHEYSSVPYTVTYFDTEYSSDIPSDGQVQSKISEYRMCIRLDLRGLDRTSYLDPYVDITGTYAPGVLTAQYISLTGVTGIVCAEVSSELGTFWQRLQGLLVALFGAGDPEAAEGAATQEQVNYDMNLQIVDAMEDWETNVTVVKDGYNTAFSNVTPSLSWVGDLATRIFDKMGWFSTIYLLIGLMSVFMLVLSKSGIASKISGAIRRK